MAQVLQFKIKAEDQASPALRMVQTRVDAVAKSTANLKPILIGAGVAFAALAAAGMKAVQAFAEAEQAQKELNDALKIAGVYSDAYSDRLSKVALELQNLTGVGDETIKNTQTLLVSFGLVGTKLEEATRLTVDFAKAQGVDLKAAALVVGKAFAGETGALSRYGIVIDESIPKTERFNEVLRQLQSRFGGRAAGAADTLTGQINIFKEALGDMAEAIGGAIVASLTTLGGGITKVKAIFDEVTTFLAGTTEATIRQQIAIWGELAGVFQFLGDKLPDWLGAKKFQDISQGLQGTQKQLQAALQDVLMDEKAAIELANKRYEVNVKNNQAIALQAEARKKQIEAEKELAKLAEVRAKYEKEAALAAEAANIQKAVQGGDIASLQSMREMYQQQVSVINLKQAQTVKEFELLAAQKKAYEGFIDNITDAINLATQARIQRTAGTISSFASGDLVGVFAQYLGPQGAIVSAITQLVMNAKDLPKKISEFMDGLIEGLIDGIPILLDYLSGPFIKDLMTKFVPGLVRSLAASFGEIMGALIQALGEMIANIPGLLGGIVKGFAKGIWDGIKGIGKAIGSLFGLGGDEAPFEGLTEALKQLQPFLKDLSDGLRENARNILRSIETDPVRRGNMLRNDYGAGQAAIRRLTDELFQAVTSKQYEKIPEIQQAIQEKQIELQNIAKEYYDIQLERLDEILAKEKEKYEVQRSAIEKTIEELKSWKTTAINAFQAVRKTILGEQMSPGASVAEARALFEAAPVAQRAAAAQDYATALQNQYRALQSLAAQGAISGEEFLAAQEDILAQLDQAEAQTIDQFDTLISVNEKQLQTLDAGFAAFTASIEKQRSELKAVLTDMLNQLTRMAEVWVGTKETSAGVVGPGVPTWGFRTNFNLNTGGIKNVVQTGIK